MKLKLTAILLLAILGFAKSTRTAQKTKNGNPSHYKKVPFNPAAALFPAPPSFPSKNTSDDNVQNGNAEKANFNIMDLGNRFLRECGHPASGVHHEEADLEVSYRAFQYIGNPQWRIEPIQVFCGQDNNGGTNPHSAEFSYDHSQQNTQSWENTDSFMQSLTVSHTIKTPFSESEAQVEVGFQQDRTEGGSNSYTRNFGISRGVTTDPGQTLCAYWVIEGGHGDLPYQASTWTMGFMLFEWDNCLIFPDFGDECHHRWLVSPWYFMWYINSICPSIPDQYNYYVDFDTMMGNAWFEGMGRFEEVEGNFDVFTSQTYDYNSTYSVDCRNPPGYPYPNPCIGVPLKRDV